MILGVTCRARVKVFRRDAVVAEPLFLALKDCPQTTIETRLQWAKRIAEKFRESPKCHDRIRPWDFILNLDGSIESASVPQNDCYDAYPVPFRIPPKIPLGLSCQETSKRAEMFALGSLLYEIMSTRKPFEELDDDEILARYSIGHFPDEVRSLPLSPIILECWNQVVSRESDKTGISKPNM